MTNQQRIFPRNRVFQFSIGEEDHPRLSSIGRADSTLIDCYVKGLWAVQEIIGNTNQYHELLHCEQERMNSTRIHPYYDGDEIFYNYYNNLIVFSAERGCGKTSAMMTFSRTLTDIKGKLDISEVPELCKIKQSLANETFIVMQPVDPTVLSERHDILTVILSRLFQFASKIWEKNYRSDSASSWGGDILESKNRILQLFRKCNSALISMKKRKYHRDDDNDWNLEGLAELGEAASLKSDFYTLLIEIIKLRGKDINHCHFVFQIDDADMNFNQVYNILEYIRNFLVIPNVIILLAADMELISSVLFNAFKELLPSDNRENYALLTQLTEQYILKFFPPKRQIYLPNIRDFMQVDKKSLQYVLKYNGLNENLKEESVKEPLEKGLLGMIFRRTGLFFKEHTNYNYILPTTQRGVGHLLRLLNNLSEIDHLEKLYEKIIIRERIAKKELSEEQIAQMGSGIDSNGNSGFDYLYYMQDGESSDRNEYVNQLFKWRANVETFRDYFMNDWVRDNLSIESQRFMNTLHKVRLTEKNGVVINWIQKGSANGKKVTYTEMLRILQIYQRQTMDEQIEFAVHTYYSVLTQQIILTELIDYYNSKQERKKDEVLCEFKALYSLYGSELIPYEMDTSMPEAAKPIKIPSNYISKFISNEGTKNYDHLELHPLWNYNLSDIVYDTLKKDVFQRRCFSLFIRGYHETGFESANWGDCPMDICAPIINILYVSKFGGGNEDTHGAKVLSKPKDVNNEYSDDIAIELRQFQDMCIRLVVNWDYQREVLNTLYKLPYKLERSDLSTVDGNRIYGHIIVEAFYKLLARLLENSVGEGKKSMYNWLSNQKHKNLVQEKYLAMEQLISFIRENRFEDRANVQKILGYSDDEFSEIPDKTLSEIAQNAAEEFGRELNLYAYESLNDDDYKNYTFPLVLHSKVITGTVV